MTWLRSWLARIVSQEVRDWQREARHWRGRAEWKEEAAVRYFAEVQRLRRMLGREEAA